MSRTLWAAVLALVLVAAARASDAGSSRGRAPDPPRLLSQTGLYEPGGLSIDARNRVYSPQYPLWTDGAAKRRWIRLPDGAVIDARDEDQWIFPVGTRLWKEFAFGGRPIETRFLWRARENAWVFASYVWNAEGTDAVLAPAEGARNVALIGGTQQHSVPSVDDCHACHEDGRVLGFSALQLSTDRDPLAPHADPFEAQMVTIQTLMDEGRLRGARGDLAARPPRIDAKTPVGRAALGYLSANCGICHRDGAPIDTRLRLHVPGSGNTTEVGTILTSARVSWDIPSIGGGMTRFVKPGHPEASSIVARMTSRRPSTQMPPLGTVTVDRTAVELVSRWIRESGE